MTKLACINLKSADFLKSKFIIETFLLDSFFLFDHDTFRQILATFDSKFST